LEEGRFRALDGGPNFDYSGPFPRARDVSINRLAEYNQVKRRQFEAVRDRLVAAHRAAVPPAVASYPLARLEARVVDALSARWGKGTLDLQLEMIERERHNGDFALKIPMLLRDGGPKVFIKDHLPWIVEILSGPGFADAIARVETKGMYINLTLTDRWLLDGAQAVVDMGARFGLNDSMRTRTFLVDYSSPNVAKVLHAGHIRSTIVGHVLSNLYEACGAIAYRVNHINDFGGFGFVLEGYRRFEKELAAIPDKNDRQTEIYRIRRTVERIVGANTPLDAVPAEERSVVSRYFPIAASTAELAAQFVDYTAAADRRFAALEAGDAEEVALWSQMVDWSLKAFDRFYDALNIHFELTIGESFYFEAGDRVIDACLQAGTAVVFTQEKADAAIRELDARLAAEEITKTEHESLAALVLKDIGAVVIPLDKGERLVVRRADGLSIYATRDIGAVKLRRDIFDPSDMIYVVGQEQQVHFDRLFRAAYIVGLAAPEKVRFQHLYFGFYVDAATGKKLSSRDTVANVTHLLAESIRYFRSRLSDRAADQPGEDLDQAARELAIGSLVFNDLKQDIKGSVDINTSNMMETIHGFEKSGAAYVVYAACRARSILRRNGQGPQRASAIQGFSLDNQEVELLLKLQMVPQKIAVAARQANPSLLVRHLTEIATTYNSYYNRAPVIVDGVANPARLLITAAVTGALVSGLAVCHVTCPAAI
jgi:arginyl-tRNA synthetase